jgi:hypothetical protein
MYSKPVPVRSSRELSQFSCSRLPDAEMNWRVYPFPRSGCPAGSGRGWIRTRLGAALDGMVANYCARFLKASSTSLNATISRRTALCACPMRPEPDGLWRAVALAGEPEPPLFIYRFGQWLIAFSARDSTCSRHFGGSFISWSSFSMTPSSSASRAFIEDIDPLPA